MNHSRTLARLEQLERRLCLSTVAFETHDIECCSAINTSVFAADIDSDGDVDLVSAGPFSERIGWYENTDGVGTFGPQKPIAPDATKSVFAADVDGDGDTDLLSASYDATAWYENIDGLGGFSRRKVISSQENGASSILGVDMDGDGDVDALTLSYDKRKIVWHENTDGFGAFGDSRQVNTDSSSISSIVAIDVDGDGDIDVLSASSDDEIVWHENLDGQGSFGGEREVAIGGGHWSVYAADVDGDGDTDVLSELRSGQIVWYENANGSGAFSEPKGISAAADAGAGSVVAADMDGDGDVDVVSAGRVGNYFVGEITWYENTSGTGDFAKRATVQSKGIPRRLSIADLDGDGDNDMLSTFVWPDAGLVAWYENDGGLGSFAEHHIISSKANGASSVFATDIDGDGDIDMLSASYADGKIAWYENIDGAGTFGQQKVISNEVDLAYSVFAADVDNDGDIDVLSASNWEVLWHENTDGTGTFSQQKVIAEANGGLSVYAVDIDGDDDVDVLWASQRHSEIAWYENTDGLGTFGQQNVITHEAIGAHSVAAADVDGDGDIDVLSASYHEIAWYENIDGLGSFGRQDVITYEAERAKSVYAVDLDGDGDIDVLSASYEDGKIAWYENIDGAGTFGQQNIIGRLQGASSIFAADVDDDGDIDVLAGSYDVNTLTWYENTDRRGSFSQARVIATDLWDVHSIDVADVDGDGDIDVLSASRRAGRLAWHSQRLIGDVNDDGLFDSADLVRVFQAGMYEDGIQGNSRFDDGDWNNDGDFDSADLVLGFQAGHYVSAAKPQAAEIAAAVDWLFAKDGASKPSRAFVA